MCQAHLINMNLCDNLMHNVQIQLQMQDKCSVWVKTKQAHQKMFPPDTSVAETWNTAKHSVEILASLLNCLDFKRKRYYNILPSFTFIPTWEVLWIRPSKSEVMKD